MARRSLKPQLNQIRAWVRQGRTDAWIAHQLEVSASELREFRSQHELTPDAEDTGAQEIDLRDEIEAEVEAATAEEAAVENQAEAEEAAEEEAGEEAEEAEEGEEPEQGLAGGVGAAGAAAGVAAKSSRPPSTTVRPTATASGSTRRSRTTPCMPSIGPASGRSWSGSTPIRSSFGAPGTPPTTTRAQRTS